MPWAVSDWRLTLLGPLGDPGEGMVLILPQQRALRTSKPSDLPAQGHCGLCESITLGYSLSSKKCPAAFMLQELIGLGPPRSPGMCADSALWESGCSLKSTGSHSSPVCLQLDLKEKTHTQSHSLPWVFQLPMGVPHCLIFPREC